MSEPGSKDNSMEGRVVVVTGGNSGIGAETARALCRLGATVVLACRDQARAEAAAAAIRADTGSDAVHLVSLNLADMASVRRTADEVLERFDRLDVLVNNAGGILSPRRVSAQGWEATLAVNHLGHFALTLWLLDRLDASAPSRIVNVASAAHWAAVRGMRFDDLQAERRYRPFDVYARSKLANILFTRELARRLDPSRVTVNAAHPGPVRSGFGMDGDLRGLAGLGNRLVRPFEITPERGAATVVYLATAPELAATTGGYFARCRPARVAPWGRSAAAAERLWEESRRLLADAGFPVPEVPGPATSGPAMPAPDQRR